MKVLELKDLQREEGHIFYIRKYTADAIIEIASKLEPLKIKFIIEMDPFGNKTISLTLLSQLAYPLIPLRKALIEFILNQEQDGKIPC